MGLDQYFFILEKKRTAGGGRKEITLLYLRKHYELDRLMTEIMCEKGHPEDRNCYHMKVDKEIADRIISEANKKRWKFLEDFKKSVLPEVEAGKYVTYWPWW